MSRKRKSQDLNVKEQVISDLLRVTAANAGYVLSNPTDPEFFKHNNIKMLTLEQLIEQTASAVFDKHHQIYPIDQFTFEIGRHFSKELQKQLAEKGIKAGLRIEHTIEKVAYIEGGDSPYIIHSNIIEGSDNFSRALSSWARNQKSNFKDPFNADACATFLLAKKKDPFHPIATAVYSFRNGQVYAAFRGNNGNYIGQKGNMKEFPATLPAYVEDSWLNKGSLTFFIADYKLDIPELVVLLEKALMQEGESLKPRIQIERIRGTPASAANILKVVIEQEAQGYVDARLTEEINKKIKDLDLGGKFASLKLTNVLAVLPIGYACGYEARTIGRQKLEVEYSKLDLSDPKCNPDITLVLAPKQLFAEEQSPHRFNVERALKGVEDQIKSKVKEFLDEKEHRGYGYEIPNYRLINRLDGPEGEGTYKKVWLAEKIDDKSQVVVKTFELTERGKENLEKIKETIDDQFNKERRMLASLKGTTNITFLESSGIIGKGPNNSPVAYLVEDRFEQSLRSLFPGGSKASLEQTLTLGRGIMKAIADCHEREVIHGDIKDANIGIKHIGKNIEAVVTDFGTAYLIGQSKPTETNVGSILTMAPELYEKGSEPSPESDVFAISCVLFKLNTGNYPFSPPGEKPHGNDPERKAYEEFTINQKMLDDYSHIFSKLELPQEAANVIINGMTRDPKERKRIYKNAVEMLAAWKEVMRRDRIYNEVKKWIMDSIADSKPEAYLNPHLPRTEEWLLKLNPNASYACRIAALAHDCERINQQVSTHEPQDSQLSYSNRKEKYESKKTEHAKLGGEQVAKKLSELRADANLVSQVRQLIAHHDDRILQDSTEYNPDELQDLVDADSLSYFQVNQSIYNIVHKMDPTGIKVKVDMMYDKMSEHARKMLVKMPFFNETKEKYLHKEEYLEYIANKEAPNSRRQH